MNDSPKNPEPLKPGIEQVLNGLGRVLSTAAVYGMDHPRARKEVSDVHADLHVAFSGQQRMRLDLVSGRLFVNGSPVTLSGPMIRVITTRLAAKKISGFSIDRGLTVEGLSRLLSLIAAGKSGTFERDLAAAGIPGVQAEKLEYQAVRPGEKGGGSKPGLNADSGTPSGPESRQKSAAEARRGTGSGAALSGSRVLDLDAEEASGWSADARDSDTAKDSQARTDTAAPPSEIIAFLRGNAPGTPETGQELARLLSEPERLANLILESAAVRRTDSSFAQGESMADLILGCLRRTYEGLRAEPAVMDDSAAPPMRKALLLLEKNILERFRSMMRPADPNTEATIHAALRQMDEDLELDAAAAHYVEHRAALVRSEKRIVEYLKSRGPQAVEPHVRDAGLPLSDWKRLCIRGSGPGREGGGRGDGPPAGLGTLALILERFDSLMRQESRDSGHIRDTMEDLEAGLDVSADKTARGIDRLEPGMARLRARNGEEAEHARKMLGQLAEISQELLQPLTVINCSLQMLLDGFLGQVVKEQRDVLELSSASGERMKEQMDRLIAVVGYPRDPKIPGTMPTAPVNQK